LHVLENIPTRVPWSNICNDSDDLLLKYKYLSDIRGVAPEDYTVAHNSVNVSKIRVDYFLFLLGMNILQTSRHSML
jgi:hypothetical protein